VSPVAVRTFCHFAISDRTNAPNRHVDHLDPGHVHEELPRHVIGVADTARGEAQLPRPRFSERDQLLDLLHRETVVDREDVRLSGHLRDRSQILERVVSRFAIETGADGKTGVRVEQCVT
jgi:hypothetical protein